MGGGSGPISTIGRAGRDIYRDVTNAGEDILTDVANAGEDIGRDITNAGEDIGRDIVSPFIPIQASSASSAPTSAPGGGSVEEEGVEELDPKATAIKKKRVGKTGTSGLAIPAGTTSSKTVGT